ncbi:hypothetical protein FPV67DRAFT_1779227 [Lyophyllum atratum]|nr:hypothetical protein FPV67DRAFT_1779227 [Lyophyllum atratum]
MSHTTNPTYQQPAYPARTRVKLSVSVPATELNAAAQGQFVDIPAGETVEITDVLMLYHTPQAGVAPPELTALNAAYRVRAKRERTSREPVLPLIKSPMVPHILLAQRLGGPRSKEYFSAGESVFLREDFEYKGGRAGSVTLRRGTVIHIASQPLSRKGSERVSKPEESHYVFQLIESVVQIYYIGNHRHNAIPHNQLHSSKLSVSNVRDSVKELLADANGEKKRNFVETIELQISTPDVPLLQLEYMSVDDLKKCTGSRWFSAWVLLSATSRMNDDQVLGNAIVTMPEYQYRECVAHYLVLLWWYEHWKLKTPLALIALWADGSKTEAANSSNASDGHVYRLDATCDVIRGTSGAQTSLWPPTWKKTRKNPNPPSINTLSLKDITMTGRAVILDLGKLFLKFSYLTHTSVQIYPRNVWYTSVCGIDKSERGFRVGLALEFGDFIIAFVTIDMVFQPIWTTTKAKLPITPPDAYYDYSAFLEGVVKWIKGRSDAPRTGLALKAVRNTQDVWSGIGVYTASELFFDAGLSPFLTEAEVFDSPSRSARLCEAFWCFAHRSHTKLQSLLRPCMVKGLLAPTKEQRLKYKNWLHVYAKDRVQMPARLGVLVDEYQLKLQELGGKDKLWFRNRVPLYDPFEPEYIVAALNRKSPPPLGRLIFGKEVWVQLMKGDTSLPTDPLSSYFGKKSILQELKTFLKPKHYTALLPDSQLKCLRPTYAFKMRKQVWSVTDMYPVNSRATSSSQKMTSTEIEPVIGADRTKLLFKTIVEETCSVAIGPLEYCGNGRVVRDNHGRKLLSAVRGDPGIASHHAVRELVGIARIKAGLDKRGHRKQPMSNAQRTKLALLKVQGVPRVWKPEGDIDSTFKKAKEKDETLELVPSTPPKSPQSTPPSNTPSPPSQATDALSTDDFDFSATFVVFTETKTLKLTNKFRWDTDAYYVKAKCSTVASIAQIPFWIWCPCQQRVSPSVRPLVDVGWAVVDIFSLVSTHDPTVTQLATSFLLDALKDNKPEQGNPSEDLCTHLVLMQSSGM